MSEPKRQGARGLALNPGNLVPGVNAAQPGEARALKHGARTTSPQRSPEWSPAVQTTVDDLRQLVGAELRDEHGEVHAWAQPSVEAVAIQRVACWRLDRYVADQEAKGKLTPDALDLQSKVGERYHKALEREALTLRSRLDAQVRTQDIFERHVARVASQGEAGS